MSRHGVQAVSGVALSFLLVIACASDEDKFDARMEAARVQIDAHEWQIAIIELRGALQLAPDSAEVNFALAETLEQVGEYGNAIFYYEEAARLAPDSPDASIALARLLLGDDTERSKALVAEMMTRFPENSEVHVLRSSLALIDEDLDEALGAALTATELGPERGRSWIALGRANHARVREARLERRPAPATLYDDALAAFARAREIDGPGALGAFEYVRLLSTTPKRVDEAGPAFVELLDAVPELDIPLRTEVSRSLIEYASRTENPELMRRGFAELTAVDPGNLQVWAHWSQLEESIEPGAGEGPYQKLIQKQPENPEAHVRYSVYLMAMGRGDDARSLLATSAVQLPANAPRFLAPLAEISEPEQAQRIREDLVRDHPDHPFTELSLIQELVEEKKLNEAVARLTALTTRAEHPDFFRYLAIVELQRRQTTGALRAVAAAIERTHGFDSGLIRLRARILCQAGDYRRCLRALRAVSQRGIALTQRERLMQATCQYELERPDVGRALLDRILAQPNPTTLSVLTFARREMLRDPEAVAAVLDAAIATRPDNVQLQRLRARVDITQGNDAAALARIDKVVESKQDDAPFRVLRAQVRYRNGDLDGAAEDARVAAELNPNLHSARLVLAQVYTQQDKLDELVADMEASERSGTLSVGERFLLATLNLQLGNEERAEELFEGVLEARPNHGETKNELAYLLAKRDGDLDRALDLARDAVVILPDSADAASTLGYVYLKRGLTEPALSQFDAALELNTEEAGLGVLYYHRGLALAALGRTEEASSAIKLARTADPELVMELPSDIAIE